MRTLLLAVVATLFLATLASAADDTIDVGAPIVVGEPLPRIRLPTIDGGTFDTQHFEAYRERALLIEFASW